MTISSAAFVVRMEIKLLEIDLLGHPKSFFDRGFNDWVNELRCTIVRVLQSLYPIFPHGRTVTVGKNYGDEGLVE